MLVHPFYLREGEVLFREGEVATQIFFLGEGTIELIRNWNDSDSTKSDGPNLDLNASNAKVIPSRQVLVGVIKAPSHFGEVAVVNNVTRPCWAAAFEFCELFFLNKNDVMALGQIWPRFNQRLEESAKKTLLSMRHYIKNARRASRAGEDIQDFNKVYGGSVRVVKDMDSSVLRKESMKHGNEVEMTKMDAMVQARAELDGIDEAMTAQQKQLEQAQSDKSKATPYKVAPIDADSSTTAEASDGDEDDMTARTRAEKLRKIGQGGSLNAGGSRSMVDGGSPEATWF